jgi:A118 family predicted phage portal protein
VGLTIFSPEIREKSFLARKQEYLRTAENIIGLKRGLLSEVEAAERTATEVTSSKGDYAITITDLQDMWTAAVNEAVVLCGQLGQLYKIHQAHEIDPEDVHLSYGDGVLYDRDKANQEMLAQVQSGILTPERYLGWYYELPADTPEERAAIRAAYMPDIRQLTEE